MPFCPHCKIVVTTKELATGECPVCKKGISDATDQAKPFEDAEQEKSSSADTRQQPESTPRGRGTTSAFMVGVLFVFFLVPAAGPFAETYLWREATDDEIWRIIVVERKRKTGDLDWAFEPTAGQRDNMTKDFREKQASNFPVSYGKGVLCALAALAVLFLVRLNTRRWLLLLTILMFLLSLINLLYAVDTRDGNNVLTWILLMRAAATGLYFALFPFLLVSRPRSASQSEQAQSDIAWR